MLELERRRLPSTFTVSSTADDGGGGTLRMAILAADSAGGSNTVAFSPAVFDVPQTIVLTQGEVPITSGSLTIQGPGAGLLTVNGDAFDRVFQVDAGVSATISGLTITGGSTTGNGGALLVQGQATVANCTISGDTATSGGAIYASGTLSMTGCTISGDTATNGAAIYSSGTLSMTGCTVGGDMASYGGGIWNRGTLSMTGCTIDGSSAYMGGGLLNYEGGHATLTDCTISGNSAELGGGLSNYGLSSLTACTVSGNTASNTSTDRAVNPGGGIYNYARFYGGKTTLVDTIVAGNLGAASAPSDIGGDNAISVIGSYDLIGPGGYGGIYSGLNHDTVTTNLAALGLAPLGDYGGPTPTMALLPGSLAVGKGTSASGVTADQRGFGLDSPVDVGADQAVSIPLVVGVATDGQGAPSGLLDLRAAVDLADLQTSAATITFGASAFGTAQTIVLADSPLSLKGTIAIDGPSAGLTVSGGGTARVFQVGTGAVATISGLTIAGGAAVTGGGLYNQGTATLTDCTIAGNSAEADGGGLANLGVLSLVECTVAGNTAGGGGGGLYNDALASLTACTITGNTASGAGGLYEGSSGAAAATLGDTIVAGDSAGGSASEIGGAGAADVAGTYDLIGPGGSGGIAGGSAGDIVLTSLGGLGLAPLGNYGGAMATVALLPGSPAIDAGSVALLPAGLSTDQRGQPRVVGGGVDIGAVESQGFTLTTVAGSTPQSALLGAGFPEPLAVTVSANDPAEPVAGGTVTYTVDPAGGTGATLSATSATIGADGSVQVYATANGSAGSFQVTASAAGAASVSFALTNINQSAFSGLSNPTIAYGTASATFSGFVYAGSSAPAGEQVAVTLDGVTQPATIQAGGSFSTSFDTAGLGVAGSPYTVTYAYAGDGTFPSASATGTLTVTRATPTVDVSDPGGTYSGEPFAATATVAGVGGSPGTTLEGAGLSLTYYAGTTATGSPLGGPPTTAGTYTVQAGFPGSTDYAARSSTSTFTISPATPTIAWSTPSPIVYGTALSSTQLDANAVVAGSFVYSPAAGTVLGAGAVTLSVTFDPTDSSDYTTATATVQLVVARATPTLTWNTPAAITYGTALGSPQLDAQASVAGTFAYNPAAGAVPDAGTQTLSVNFTPTNTTDYTTATATTQLVVNQAMPTITWGTPAAITYGTLLGSTQLDATASVSGTFAYNPGTGTKLGAGTQTLSVTFTPSDTTDYTTATATTQLVVKQATPAITWPSPPSITYGTALGASQLDATASTAGTFTYSPVAGTVLGAGTQTLSVTFTPTDTTDYKTATATVSLAVDPASPALTWPTPSSITYGTPLGPTQLDATANVSGSFTYTPAAGAVLRAGTDTLSVTFTPTDTTDYTTATATVSLVISQATPTITWEQPSSITYGTSLGSTQLDATAKVAGTFTYTPAAGTVLTAGTQTLSVSFDPTDSTDYKTTTATIQLVVNQATPAITWETPASIVYGTPLGSTQLDATSSVSGTFTYSPVAGTVLDAGTQTLSVTFNPSDTTDYQSATATTTLAISRATPTIAWPSPSSIVYGTALGSTQLDANSTVSGTFAYDPGPGAILDAGTDTLSVSFTPTDTTDYLTTTTTATIVVTQATPTITWTSPSSIAYGTALGSVQLDAQASVPGTFAYNPAPGSIPGAGTDTLSVTFTPTDGNDDTTASASTTIVVAKATPAVHVSGGGIYDGAPIPATATVAGVDASPSASLEGVSPTLTYYAGSTASGTPLTGAPTTAGTYTVLASFPGSADYGLATTQASFSITPATPVITWGPLGSIVYGTELGLDQLDATANIPGNFSYEPDTGAILAVGTDTLALTFTPDDTTDYTSTTATTTIAVTPIIPTITWATPQPIAYGTPLSATQLDASSGGVPGTFTYDPPLGTQLGAGTRTLSVTFTPDDTNDYATVKASTTIVVDQATPQITWPEPSSITYGTVLGPAEFDARSNVPGQFTYSPAAGSVPAAGGQTLSATFTPTDTADYASATATTTLDVSPAAPGLAWSPPASIAYGTALGPGQLDAAAATQGTLTYSPAAGTILGAGVHTLSVSFTPADARDYTPAATTATITVAPAVPTVLVVDAGGAYDGSPFAATAIVSGAGGASGTGLEGVDAVVTYYAGDAATGPALGGPPSSVGTYTALATFAGSADYAAASGAPVTFAIAPAPTSVTLTSSAGSLVVGQSVTLTATVSAASPGAGIPTGTVTFLDGGETLGAVAIDAAGQAIVTVAGLGLGGDAIMAVYGGDADRAGSQSAAVAESVAAAGTQIVLVPHATLKKKKVTSVSFTAEVEPLAPGGGLPTGTVSFRVKKKVLGTVALSGGQATLSPRPSSVLNKPITVIYEGTTGYDPTQLTIPKLTSRSLLSLARPSIADPLSRPISRKPPRDRMLSGPNPRPLSLNPH